MILYYENVVSLCVDGGFISDEIINTYIEMLMIWNDDSVDDVLLQCNWFLQALLLGLPDNDPSYTEQYEAIRKKKRIYMPVNTGGHWVLMVSIKPTTSGRGNILVFDSISESQTNHRIF